MEEGSEPPDFDAEIVEVDGVELHLDPVYLTRTPDDDGELRTALPPRLESWRRRSATGAILTGIGLGLKKALEPDREEPSIIMQASGEPPTDLPVEADLGGILPGDSVVKIRPWLLTSDVSVARPADPTAARPPSEPAMAAPFAAPTPADPTAAHPSPPPANGSATTDPAAPTAFAAPTPADPTAVDPSPPPANPTAAHSSARPANGIATTDPAAPDDGQ